MTDHPSDCYPCKGTGRVIGFGAANGGPCPADHSDPDERGDDE